jgi:Ecdysteroid kinase-like family
VVGACETPLRNTPLALSCALRAGQSRALSGRLDSFPREVGFYDALAAMPARARESDALLPVARAFFAAQHAPTGTACLLFEDLTAAGYMAGDQVKGASGEMATRIVTDMAKHHAACATPFSTRDSGASPSSSWLPALGTPRFFGFDAAGFNDTWPAWKARYGHLAAALPPHVLRRLDAGVFPDVARDLLTRCGHAFLLSLCARGTADGSGCLPPPRASLGWGKRRQRCCMATCDWTT